MQGWGDLLASDVFCMKKAYALLRPNISKVPWCDLIVQNLVTPRAKIILWLALRDRLATRERLQVYCEDLELNCVFCTQDIENQEHLFFNCLITREAWRALIR